MNKPEIEKGVPMPTTNGRGNRKYPWRNMEVGDSFFVPGGVTTPLSSAAGQIQMRTGFKFSCRKVDGGVRVWRVA